MKKIKVVVIDDEIEYLNDIAKGLEILGYEVIKAADGSHGVDAIVKGKPDIVLCDYKLDDMDGTQIISRTKPGNPGAIFIMVTAYYDESFDEIFKKAGADEVIFKPIQLTEVDVLIRGCLDARKKKV
jgi:two-component system, NtrC family, response regulator HydG